MSHLTQLGKFLLGALLNLIMELTITTILEEDFLVIASPLPLLGWLDSLGPWAGSVGSHPGHLAERQVGHALLPAYHSLALLWHSLKVLYCLLRLFLLSYFLIPQQIRKLDTDFSLVS